LQSTVPAASAPAFASHSSAKSQCAFFACSSAISRAIQRQRIACALSASRSSHARRRFIVVGANMRHRHLSIKQRAMIADQIAEYSE
jgi:hypothetical protein